MVELISKEGKKVAEIKVQPISKSIYSKKAEPSKLYAGAPVVQPSKTPQIIPRPEPKQKNGVRRVGRAIFGGVKYIGRGAVSVGKRAAPYAKKGARIGGEVGLGAVRASYSDIGRQAIRARRPSVVRTRVGGRAVYVEREPKQARGMGMSPFQGGFKDYDVRQNMGLSWIKKLGK